MVKKRDPEQLDVLDGYEAPPPSHRHGPDTEREAAASLAPAAKLLRQKVLALALDAGRRGVTGWEATVALGMSHHETSVRPRLTELSSDRHGRVLTKSRARRPNRNGNREVVYVATDYLEGVSP